MTDKVDEGSAAMRGSLTWIPVTERLPEPDSIVLVVVVHPGRTDPYYAVGVWSGSHWYIEDDALPTYWTPLPAMPTDSK